jgi:hypothetical protein
MPSGSAPGERRGGRQKGSLNKRTIGKGLEKRTVSKKMLMPLEYMLDTLRSPKSTVEDKRWAAEKAAPYCHAKPQANDGVGAQTVQFLGTTQINVQFVDPDPNIPTSPPRLIQAKPV